MPEFTPSTPYTCHKAINYHQSRSDCHTKTAKSCHHFQETGHLTFCSDTPLVWLFSYCTCLILQLAIFLQFTSDKTVSLVHSMPAKLSQDEITAYVLSVNNTSKLLSSVTFPAFSLLITVFVFITFTLLY